MPPDTKGLKVLHLIDSGGLYGAEKMLLALVKEQVRQGLEPMILSAGEPGIEEKALEAEARRLGAPIISWRMQPGMNFREANNIVRWAKSKGFQIMHSHGYKFNILIGLMPRVIRKLPLLVTRHGYVHSSGFSKMQIYKLLDGFATSLADHVVFVSSKMLSQPYKKKWRAGRLTIVRNGLDIARVLEESSLDLTEEDRAVLNNRHPIIMGVGRLAKEKGFDRAIEAMSRIRLAKPNAVLVIIGEGPERKPLSKLAQDAGVSDCVFFLGYRADVAAWLRAADILLMPSLTEGLPITLLEAMALRIPVIATPVGDIPSVLGNGYGGILLKETHPEELAKEVERILQAGPVIAKMRNWAFDRIHQDFSSTRMELDYRHVYLSLLV